MLHALIRGLRIVSDSAREYSWDPPSWSGAGREDSEGEESEEVEVGGGCSWGSGEVRISRTDLHSCPNFECLRHDAFLMIFSKAGDTTWLNRESASVEAIPESGR